MTSSLRSHISIPLIILYECMRCVTHMQTWVCSWTFWANFRCTNLGLIFWIREYIIEFFNLQIFINKILFRQMCILGILVLVILYNWSASWHIITCYYYYYYYRLRPSVRQTFLWLELLQYFFLSLMIYFQLKMIT